MVDFVSASVLATDDFVVADLQWSPLICNMCRAANTTCEYPTYHFDTSSSSDQSRYRSFISRFVNGSSWSALDPGQANIFQVTSNSSSFSLPESSQLNIVNDGIYTFDLVVNSLDDGTHPFHLHGTSKILYQDPLSLTLLLPIRPCVPDHLSRGVWLLRRHIHPERHKPDGVSCV